MRNKVSVDISILAGGFAELFSTMGRGFLLFDEFGSHVASNDLYWEFLGVHKYSPASLGLMMSRKDNPSFFREVLNSGAERQVRYNGVEYLEEGFPYFHDQRSFGLLQLSPKKGVRRQIPRSIGEERYKKFLMMNPDPVIVSDLSGTVVYASPKFYKMYQLRYPGEILGKSVLLLFDSSQGESARSIFDEIIRNGEVRNIAVEILRNDARPLKGEISGAVYKNSAGKDAGVILIVHDVTELLRIQEVLLEEALLNASVARLSQIVLEKTVTLSQLSRIFLDEILLLSSCTGGCISMVDQPTGNIIFFAYSDDLRVSDTLEEIEGELGIPAKSSMYRHFFSMFQDYGEGYFSNTPGADSPLSLLFPNQDLSDYHYLIIPMEYQDVVIGQLLMYCNSGKNISEKEFEMVKRLVSIYVLAAIRFRRQLELEAARTEAEAANSSKSSFLAGISHEIRRPLARILGLTRDLDRTALSHVQRRYLEECRNIGEDLLTTINDMLEIWQIELAGLELQHSEFDIIELTSEIVNSMDNSGRPMDSGFEISAPSDFPRFFTSDPIRVRQLMLYIIQYSMGGSSGVRIAFDERRRFNKTSEVEITVRSEQVPEDCCRDFFHHCPENWGMGLTVAKKIIEKMRGSMSILYENDLCSSFIVILPLVRSENR